MQCGRSKRIRPKSTCFSCDDTVYKIAAKLVNLAVTPRGKYKKKAISLPGGFVYHAKEIKKA